PSSSPLAATPHLYTLSLHDALPISAMRMIHRIHRHTANRGPFAMPAGTARLPVGDILVIQITNLDHENVSNGKAGRTRWHGKRPTVRGVAMNPVDHPHGGDRKSVV